MPPAATTTVTKLPPISPSPSSLSQKPAHHVGKPPTHFTNPWPSFEARGPAAVFKTRFARDRPPFVPVPSDRSELVTVRTPPDWGAGQPGLKVTWIGHASFLVETSAPAASSRGVRILCDPVFSERTSPVSFVGPKRYTPTPCALAEVPDVDAVLVSHNHYDHLDIATIRALHERRGSAIHFFAPLGNAAWFRTLGIPAEQVHDLDWWDRVELVLGGSGSGSGSGVAGGDDHSSARVTFVCTPSQHSSGRGILDRDRTLWCSWTICDGSAASNDGGSDSGGKRLFFAGDTGYRTIPHESFAAADEDSLPHCPAFAQIGAALGPFDLALLPIGLCSPRHFISPFHCNAADSVCVHRDVRSRRSIGMHWGTVRGGLSQEYEDVRDPPRWWKEQVEKAGLKWRGGKGEGEGKADDDWEAGLMDIGETIALS